MIGGLLIIGAGWVAACGLLLAALWYLACRNDEAAAAERRERIVQSAFEREVRADLDRLPTTVGYPTFKGRS